MLPSILTFLFAAATLVSAIPRNPPSLVRGGITNDTRAIAGRTFDYVVCGGGRLTEDANITVLVIEAGYDNHADPRVNDVRTYGQAFGSELDWNLTSTPISWQNGSVLPLVAGRTLGGSGSINGASWTKGASSQYDLLPLLTGDDSWGWESFNQYMLLAEHFNPPGEDEIARGAQFDPDSHGENGPVQVSFGVYMFDKPQQEALNASMKVWNKPGLPGIDADIADGTVGRAAIIPNMVQPDASQNRSSPFTAYAQRQVQERSNFVILTGQRVTEIVWEDCPGMVAEGVRFQACRNCTSHFARARREVLLAAGSLQSPQILELSGVGDPVVLAAAGVPLKMAAAGVGKHMQEQTKSTLAYTVQNLEWEGSGPSNAIAFPKVPQILHGNTSATYHWVMNGLPDYAMQLERQDLVVNASAALIPLKAQVNNLFRNNTAAVEVFFWSSPTTNQMGVDLWNLIPLSRGIVHIRTNNSWDHPIVQPSYFNHPLDIMLQTAVSKQTREVFQTQPLAQYVQQELMPGNSVGEDASFDEWEGWVKQTFTSVWHYIATLAMMKEEYGGVVDSRMKIYGIENVRAIDASVLPIQLSAHLSSSLYGIAEKAAVVIKEDQTKAVSV
ncbi:hypothetical protein LTR36_004656 [Oleoguttula mirabilis]|uniref:Glucose-methanol-choline oxidoreductase N-terminal domain-containing protein n=1 Tax=Oleoguttula mirabilis TaxID=1507867 RepID=A0AAV9JFT7_9PEZI|nr:hypothetical protein LTR36_004656 [Oleoguttula mirabilis]